MSVLSDVRKTHNSLQKADDDTKNIVLSKSQKNWVRLISSDYEGETWNKKPRIAFLPPDAVQDGSIVPGSIVIVASDSSKENALMLGSGGDLRWKGNPVVRLKENLRIGDLTTPVFNISGDNTLMWIRVGGTESGQEGSGPIIRLQNPTSGNGNWELQARKVGQAGPILHGTPEGNLKFDGDEVERVVEHTINDNSSEGYQCTRYSSGLMIIKGHRSMGSLTKDAKVAIPFPVPFVGVVPTVACPNYFADKYNVTSTLTQIDFSARDSVSLNFRYVAVGRWK